MCVKMRFLITTLFITYASAMDDQWWRHSTMYEIYTPSFKDSNNDGWGDLKGIISKLDYLKNLGVDIIWLTPYHPSPMLDTGYDVSNYTDVNPLYGTLDDFDKLIKELNKRGMKFVMDLVLNHSSDKHKWFQLSVNKVEPYTDYYVWRDPKGYDSNGNPIRPNKWSSLFGDSAWNYNKKRKQFYYSAFLPQQPDLNYRCPQMKKEIEKIVKFWFDRGVAGIRLDAINWLYEDESFADNGVIFSHPDTYKYLVELRSYVDKLNTEYNTFERIIVAEAWGGPNELRATYGNGTHSACHFPFNFLFTFENEYETAESVNSKIDYWNSLIPYNSISNYLLDSHDSFRMNFKRAQDNVNVLLALISLLPGMTILYYGEEIEMTLGILEWYQVRLTSEFSRTPMQWDTSRNGGFSKNDTTWLPVNPNYARLNVKSAMANPNSTYHYLKNLLKLKKTDPIRYGTLHKYILSEWVYVIVRSYDTVEDYIIVLNFKAEPEEIDLRLKIPILPTVMKVVLASPNAGFKKGSVILDKETRTFRMNPMSVVVLGHNVDGKTIQEELILENNPMLTSHQVQEQKN